MLAFCTGTNKNLFGFELLKHFRFVYSWNDYGLRFSGAWNFSRFQSSTQESAKSEFFGEVIFEVNLCRQLRRLQQRAPLRRSGPRKKTEFCTPSANTSNYMRRRVQIPVPDPDFALSVFAVFSSCHWTSK